MKADPYAQFPSPSFEGYKDDMLNEGGVALQKFPSFEEWVRRSYFVQEVLVTDVCPKGEWICANVLRGYRGRPSIGGKIKVAPRGFAVYWQDWFKIGERAFIFGFTAINTPSGRIPIVHFQSEEMVEIFTAMKFISLNVIRDGPRKLVKLNEFRSFLQTLLPLSERESATNG